jgi:hypothetical protein
MVSLITQPERIGEHWPGRCICFTTGLYVHERLGISLNLGMRIRAVKIEQMALG